MLVWNGGDWKRVMLLVLLGASIVLLPFGALAQSMFTDDRPLGDPNPLPVRPFESTIGPVDEKQSIADLPPGSRLRTLAEPVGLLSIRLSNGKTGRCTAALIKSDLILTNRHCHSGSSAEMTFTLDFVDSVESRRTVIPVHLKPLELGASVEEADYAVFRLKQPAPDRFGTVKFNPKALTSDLPLIVIQHPSGRPKMVAQATCNLVGVNNDTGRIEHTCDTERGSSGSPMMDAATGEVVALHHASLKSRPVNVGFSMEHLVGVSDILAEISFKEARAIGQDQGRNIKAKQAHGGFVARVITEPSGPSRPMTFEVSTLESCELALVDLNFIDGGVFVVDQSLKIHAGQRTLTGEDFLGPRILPKGEKRKIPFNPEVQIGSNDKDGKNEFLFLCFPVLRSEASFGLASNTQYPTAIQNYLRLKGEMAPFESKILIQVRSLK